MRKCRNASPQLETMESLTLLSGVAASALVLPTHAEIATKTTTSPLKGTLRGTFHGHQLGSEMIYDYDIKASGKLTPIGAATVTASLQEFPGILENSSSGSLDLITGRGTLTLQMSDLLVLSDQTPLPTSPNEIAVTYEISDGTGAYQDDTGIGVVDFTLTGGRWVDGSQAGKVAIKFTTLPKTITKS
jgi:hypothetical protein